MPSVTSIGNVTSAIDLGPSGSLQFQFAKLQLALSEMSKTSAMDYMDEITKSQEEQKKVGDMLQQARQLQTNAASSDSTQKAANKKATGYEACTNMPTEMKTYMKANDLAYDKTGNDDAIMSKDEWEVAITSLKAKLDKMGTDTQQKMIFVQDFMGQYNSYLQGANSAIQQSNQTLGELARVR